jgi:hypothetical protein
MNWNVDYNFRDVEIGVHDEGIHEAEGCKHLAFVTSLNILYLTFHVHSLHSSFDLASHPDILDADIESMTESLGVVLGLNDMVYRGNCCCAYLESHALAFPYQKHLTSIEQILSDFA